ncbi:unnamed protein product [Gemmataceae bacterium]|nr:unnamed protein product [Gemmataceae bacterium]VTU01024.1 unnamed protein product [Gemmataceae bacterium]
MKTQFGGGLLSMPSRLGGRGDEVPQPDLYGGLAISVH